MVILVSPDSRGRITLGTKVARDAQYAVTVDPEGVITLTPSAVVSLAELNELTAVRPVLSPEEAFGAAGMLEAADAVYANRESRRRGNPSRRVSTTADLNALIWGDAA